MKNSVWQSCILSVPTKLSIYCTKLRNLPGTKTEEKIRIYVIHVSYLILYFILLSTYSKNNDIPAIQELFSQHFFLILNLRSVEVKTLPIFFA